VVRPDGLVAIGDGRLLADEEGAVVGEVGKEIVGVFHVELEMLRRVVVAELHRFLGVVSHRDNAAVFPADRRDISCRQDLKLLVHFPNRAIGEVFAEADEADAAVRVVLGLPKQVAGHQRGSAASSAMMRISVGPARISIPQRPKSWRLASTTYLLPAPQSTSTGSTTPMPKAINAIAGTPPRMKIRSAPAFAPALMVAG